MTVQILIVLVGMAALIAGVVTIWYVVGVVVLGAVSYLFPLAGRRTRKKVAQEEVAQDDD